MKKHNHLKGARVYLSGPMDFVASRATEKKFGWQPIPMDKQAQLYPLQNPSYLALKN